MRTISTALVLMLVSAGSALAQSEDDEALIHYGVELRKQGRNAEALAEFQRADESHPSSRAKAQIALAEQALGRWVNAEAGLIAVLADANDAWIARNRQPLEDALTTIQDHLGSLEIDSNADGATIIVNGAVVGTSPLPGAVRVVAGTAQIEVQAQGYGAMKREIDVPPRSSVKATIVVMPVASPDAAHASAATPTGEMAETAQPPRVAPASTTSAAHTEATPWTQRAGVIALIAAAPLLATGVTAHVMRENDAGKYNDDARCFKDAQTRDQRCGKYRDAADTAGVVAIVGYAAGAAALITGVTLLLTGKTSAETEDGPHVTAQLDRHRAYLAYGVGF
jgi:hypothetical protein